MGLEIVSLLFSFVYFNKFGKKNAFIFPIYLAIIVIIETFGWFMAERGLFKQNILWYRYFGLPFQYIFFFWYFVEIINTKTTKLFFWLCLIVYLISWSLEFYFLPKEFEDKMAISNTMGSLIILILVFAYFYKLILSNDILLFYQKQSFWISVGVLIYYLGSFPFYGAGNYLYKNFENLYLIYIQVVLIFACIMYLLFTVSYIWGKEK